MAGEALDANAVQRACGVERIYDLDSLWGDAKRVEWKDASAPATK